MPLAGCTSSGPPPQKRGPKKEGDLMFSAVLNQNLNRSTCTARSRVVPVPSAPRAPQPGWERRPRLGQASGATARSPSARKTNSRSFCLDSPRSRPLLVLSETLPEPRRAASPRQQGATGGTGKADACSGPLKST